MRTHYVDTLGGKTRGQCGILEPVSRSQNIADVDCGRCLKFWQPPATEAEYTAEDFDRVAEEIRAEREAGAYAPGTATARAIADIAIAANDLGEWNATPETLRALRNYRDFGKLAAAFTPLETIATITNLGWIAGTELTPAGAAELAR